jgi:hypothetical protein
MEITNKKELRLEKKENLISFFLRKLDIRLDFIVLTINKLILFVLYSQINGMRVI